MSMINITELHKINEERQKFRISVYDKVLTKCHERIKFVSKTPQGSNFCFYVVPNIVYGVPIYNVNACVVYIVSALIKNGFYVAYTHPNLLYISWYNKQNTIEYKKKKEEKKPEVEYKKVENFKPKNNFIYDVSSLDFLKK
uniref:Uncharacterized protein n=1 Tax=Mimiviridae sp. ChoanoV1 TaxID=2596887 RepID=A0A5B8IQM6_9VIRU|nr:hypothetical protein 5_71 [Mimiviridae sp. ChoanoV1]